MTLLNSKQMATFAARGFLRFDGVVPEEINQQFLAELGDVPEGDVASPEAHYGSVNASNITKY